MSKQTENEENLRRYQERIKTVGNLVQPVKEPSISELAAEGAKLLAEDKIVVKPKARLTDDTKKLNKTLALTSKNPYVRARVMVLEAMTISQKNILAEMEKTGNINNGTYTEFVRQVAKLGDKLSSQQQ